MILGYAIMTLFLTISIGFNIHSMTANCPAAAKLIFDEQRLPIHSKSTPASYNGTAIIECKREFYLFHQDQNHVCEVADVLIKNDTDVIIRGNDITTVLHIFNFEVYKIPKDIFSQFKNLRNLIVNGNHLEIIEETTFDGAKYLEVLRLSNNNLKELKSLIFRFALNLKTLDLGRNKIANIESKAFTGLENLERLYLSDNNLRRLPSDIFYPLKKLIFLSLENNRIDFIDDDAFMKNRMLKSLGLSNNTFKGLQNEIFHYFDNLTDLSISELRITELNLNGTSISTLVLRNTDLNNITLSNFPKILVSFGSPIEFLQFIINETTGDFNRLPNWGGMFYNKSIRFLFRIRKEMATQGT